MQVCRALKSRQFPLFLNPLVSYSVLHYIEHSLCKFTYYYYSGIGWYYLFCINVERDSQIEGFARASDLAGDRTHAQNQIKLVVFPLHCIVHSEIMGAQLIVNCKKWGAPHVGTLFPFEDPAYGSTHHCWAFSESLSRWVWIPSKSTWNELSSLTGDDSAVAVAIYEGSVGSSLLVFEPSQYWCYPIS